MSTSRTDKFSVAPWSSEPYIPTLETPLRCVLRPHFANTQVHLHSHPWAQMILSSQGVVRIHTGKMTFTVPPHRAIWIPPQILHTASVLEDAQLYSLFIYAAEEKSEQESAESPWLTCKVIEVRPLLHELVVALAEDDFDRFRSDRYRSLIKLVNVEISRAPVLPLGVPLPAERRLRMLCENFLAAPRLDRSVADLSREVGASVSTVSRLFQAEIGCSFSEWRKQVFLAEALTLAAKGLSVSQIAFELGYSSLSSFSFMVTQLVGIPPGKLLKMRPDVTEFQTVVP